MATSEAQRTGVGDLFGAGGSAGNRSCGPSLRRMCGFTILEAAGHALGRAVAQATTERLALARAERLTGPQPCPTCGRHCPLGASGPAFGNH